MSVERGEKIFCITMVWDVWLDVPTPQESVRSLSLRTMVVECDLFI